MFTKKFPGNMSMPQIRPVLSFVSVGGMYAEPPRAKAESMVSQGLKMAPLKKDRKSSKIHFGNNTANGGSTGTPLGKILKTISVYPDSPCFFAKDKLVAGRGARRSPKEPIKVLGLYDTDYTNS